MKKMFCFAALALALSAGRAQTTFKPGEGVANRVPATAEGTVNVEFVPRGSGNAYGYGVGRQFVTPVGLTLLPWSIPNELSSVWGLRFNLGVSRYEETQGLDVGAWSTSGSFGGLAANVAGNFVERDGSGLQIGLVNFVEGDFTGIQVGLMNKTRHLKGVQIGLMNFNPDGIFFPILNFGF